MSSTVKETFNTKAGGYLAVSAALPTALISQTREYLQKRLNGNFEKFTAWSGETITHQNYAEAAERIEYFEMLDLPPEMRTFLVGEFDAETRSSAEIKHFMQHPAVRKLACEQLKVDACYMQYPPAIKFSVGHPGQVPPQPSAGCNEQSQCPMIIWIPLNDITDEIGGVIFGEANEKAIYPRMQVGDVLLYGAQTPHTLAPNTSAGLIRYSIELRIFTDKSAIKESYLDPATGQAHGT